MKKSICPLEFAANRREKRHFQFRRVKAKEDVSFSSLTFAETAPDDPLCKDIYDAIRRGFLVLQPLRVKGRES